MRYKTIVLELLEQRPELHVELRASRKLLATVEEYATLLKGNHEAWLEQLQRWTDTYQPGQWEREASQLSNMAMEFAIDQLIAALPPASPSSDEETFSLDNAMAYLRRQMVPA